jgi:Flp pilus assembly protein TadG
MLELALLSPWVFLLFIGALDWGFYSYALVSLEAATRTAALYASGDSGTAVDQTRTCQLVLGEMRTLPNIGAAVTTCGMNPVVTTERVTGPDGAFAAEVTVTYQTVGLIPIPGLLSKQATITRMVKMRIRRPDLVSTT